MIPVILSGGSGTRLWPYSRSLHPKQFLPLASELTMLQETLARLQGSITHEQPIVVCNNDHRFMVAEQTRLQGIKPSAIILEPVARNTAPAVALAALQAMLSGDDPVLLVLPADHVIANQQAFHHALNAAESAARDNQLVTFGIVPTQAETGYGYIRAEGDGAVLAVQQFVEKPNVETAQAYVNSGDYYWNSGMFAFKASVFLAELKKFAPDMLEACQKAIKKATNDLDFIRVDEEAFSLSPDDSIDYAVMEKTDKAVLIPLDAQWSDVGSWSALWEIAKKDSNGNACRGDVLVHESRDSYIQSDRKLIATIGVDNLIIVETDDAILVAHKDKVQDVKAIVGTLKSQNRSETQLHRKVYRPWGYYDSIDQGERFQVKRIVVNPGQKLSLQKHHHRAEHWIVVSGTALVTRGDEELTLCENQSTYIPLGVKHRLENKGVIPLEIIEIQSGSYLGEDDIVRYEDTYGRS
jgi:mannose-1-phosphate guanylyltransferase/mannose-1-phosphate guanylyltransferase/mannose-6-phosphate isomerase